MHSYRWSGSQEAYLDMPTVLPVGTVTVGHYGGHTGGGAKTNEDGALVWSDADWVFAAIFDAHGSAESTDCALELLTEQRHALLARIEAGNIRQVLNAVAAVFTGDGGRERLAAVRGETACLVCFQRGQYLGWLSIGDNSLYLLHPELSRLGQFTLTTRNYFEWIGQRDSLALDVACYSSGVRELRGGEQTVALVTDGILEFGERPYEHPVSLAAALTATPDLAGNLGLMLDKAHASRARDSATVITWRVACEGQGLMPTG